MKLSEMPEPDRTAYVVEGLRAILAEESRSAEVAPDVCSALEIIRSIVVRRFDRMAAEGRSVEETLKALNQVDPGLKRKVEMWYAEHGDEAAPPYIAALQLGLDVWETFVATEELMRDGSLVLEEEDPEVKARRLERARRAYEDATQRISEEPDAEELVSNLISALEIPDLPHSERAEARLEALGPLLDAYCVRCGSELGQACRCWDDE